METRGEHPVFAPRRPSPWAGHQSSPARQPSSHHSASNGPARRAEQNTCL